MGFFIRPKDTNRDPNATSTATFNAEKVGVVKEYEDEYVLASGVAHHHRDPTRREAEPGSPLPTGGWRGSATKNVSSWFGKGTRAGKTGVRSR